MRDDPTITALHQPDVILDPLIEIARDGARRMLMAALKAEAAGFVARFADERWNCNLISGNSTCSGVVRACRSMPRQARPVASRVLVYEKAARGASGVARSAQMNRLAAERRRETPSLGFRHQRLESAIKSPSTFPWRNRSRAS